MKTDGKLDNNEYKTEYSSNSLYIQSITKKMDQAEFACTARNEYGIAEDQKITLDVLCLLQHFFLMSNHIIIDCLSNR